MADHPLRPATDRRLGEPLPHQQANQTQTHPLVEAEASFDLFTTVNRYYPVLAPISRGYPSLKGMLYTRYSPVRQFTDLTNQIFSLTCMC